MEKTKTIVGDKMNDELGLLDRVLRKIFRAEDIMPRRRDKRDIRPVVVLLTFWKSIRKFPIAFSLVVTMVSIGALIGLIVPMYVRKLVDLIASGTATPASLASAHRVVLTILGLGIIAVVVHRTAYFALNYLARGVMTDLCKRLYERLIRHEYRFFSNTSSGALVQKVNRFPTAYDVLMDRFTLTLIPLFITAIGAVVILASEQLMLAIAILIWGTLFVAYSMTIAKWKLRYDLVRAREDSKTGATVADLLINQFAIDTHAAQASAFEKFAYSVQRKMHASAFCWNIGVGLWAITSTFTQLIEFAVYSLCVYLWSKGTLSAGLLMQTSVYVRLLANSLTEVDRLIRDAYEQFANASEAVEMMTRPHGVTDASKAKQLVVGEGIVQFRDVCFAIEDRTILGGISLRVNPGERVAFVGRSGAGKSTITKLLLRLYDVDFGSIEIDGQNIAKVTLDSLRGSISYIPQGPSMFNNSILENIRFGRPSASDNEVIEAATLAHCEEFVSRMPKRYDTPVGERGLKLSGGELQRVAIARAILRNAPILICDEATSALDSESEAFVQDALMTATRGRTSFFIAHRLSTVMNVDRICVVDDGKIVEMGSHSELVELGGIYADLWKRQQEGFVPGPSETTEALFKSNVGDDVQEDEATEQAGPIMRIVKDDTRNAMPTQEATT